MFGYMSTGMNTMVISFDGSYIPTPGMSYSSPAFYANCINGQSGGSLAAVLDSGATVAITGIDTAQSFAYLGSVVALSINGSAISNNANVTTVCTGVAGGKTDITDIEIYNPDSVAVSTFLYVGGTGGVDANVVKRFSIAAKSSTSIPLGGSAWVLADGVTLRASCSSTKTPTITVFGIERT
jgi:hypothetical protein